MAVINWSQSGCEIVKTEFDWNVQLPFLKTTNGAGRTLTCESFFYAKETPNNQWKMKVHDIGNYIQISVHHYNSAKQPTIIGNPPVLVKFAIVDGQGQKGFKQMLSSYLNASYVQFILSKNAVINSKCQLPDGSIIFDCKIQSFVSLGNDLNNPKFSYAKPIDYSNQLITQFEGLLNDTKLSDFTFVLRGREFKAHKIILATRSQVFEAMFNHPTIENLTNRVEIDDVEPEVFRLILHFIYTGRISLDEMGKFATELYTAADKYMLDQLKSATETYLLRRPMSADNCFELLLLISIHPVEKLKEVAINFFRVFPIEVMATVGWKKAKKENLPWVTGILKFLFYPADIQIEEESSSKRMRLQS